MKNLLSYKLKYDGLNFSNFLDILIKNDIQIYNIEKMNNKEITFEINNVNYKKYKKLKTNYNICSVVEGGFKNLINLGLRRIGIFIGVIAIIFSSIYFGNRTMSIRVLGVTSCGDEIIKVTQEYGIEIGKVNNFNNLELEQYLLENVSNLSLVSVKKKGNLILINAVEKEQETENYEPYYSPYNMVIKSIKLISGTLNAQENSVVKKGGVLVEPFTISSNGERIEVPAKAEIIADVWFCGSETKLKETIVYEKTNEKTTYNNVSFLKSVIGDFVSPYTHYMTETYTIDITKGYFLPIYLTTTTFFETEEKIKIFDFEKEKNIYLEKSKQKAYTILPKNVTISEITQNISELSDRYIFQTYLKTTMEICNED